MKRISTLITLAFLMSFAQSNNLFGMGFGCLDFSSCLPNLNVGYFMPQHCTTLEEFKNATRIDLAILVQAILDKRSSREHNDLKTIFTEFVKGNVETLVLNSSLGNLYVIFFRHDRDLNALHLCCLIAQRTTDETDLALDSMRDTMTHWIDTDASQVIIDIPRWDSRRHQALKILGFTECEYKSSHINSRERLIFTQPIERSFWGRFVIQTSASPAELLAEKILFAEQHEIDHLPKIDSI